MAAGRDIENPVERGPELPERIGQIAPLPRVALRCGNPLLPRQRIFQIGADAAELRLPRGQWIPRRVRNVRIEHVPHVERQRIQAVLYTQQQQRIQPIAVDRVRLQTSQAAQLDDRVPRINAHRKQRDQKTGEQAICGGPGNHSNHAA